MERYLTDLENSVTASDAPRRLFVMASSGGIMSASARQAVSDQTVLSGPAGGVSAAVLVGRATGLRNVITYDMGGTVEQDVAMILDLRPRVSVDNVIGGLPLKIPQVDINTVGAGVAALLRSISTGTARRSAQRRIELRDRSAMAAAGPTSRSRTQT